MVTLTHRTLNASAALVARPASARRSDAFARQFGHRVRRAESAPSLASLAALTCHDATHGTLSTDPRVNFWLQFTAHPLFFNVFVWIPQHLLSHHQYTNDEDFDVDLHHFAPAKLSPDTDYGGDSELNAGWTFVVKGCLSTLGTTLLQPARTLLESATPNFDENITPVPEVVAKEVLALSMAPSVFVLLYPLVAFGLLDGDWNQALAAALWPYVGASIIWTTMTQTSHVQEACHEDLPDDACWTARQIAPSYGDAVHDDRSPRRLQRLHAADCLGSACTPTTVLAVERSS